VPDTGSWPNKESDDKYYLSTITFFREPISGIVVIEIGRI